MKNVWLAALLCVAPVAAQAGACSQDDAVSAKFASRVAHAQASGNACEQTRVLIDLLEATKEASRHCFMGSQLQQIEQELDAQIAQDRQSYADQGCSG